MPLRIVPKRKGRSFRNTRRENRLEELGRVDAEKAYTRKGKRNLRDEKDRIRSELKSGGRPARRPKPPEQKRKPRTGGPARPMPKQFLDKKRKPPKDDPRQKPTPSERMKIKKVGPRDVGRHRIDKLGYTTHGGGPDAGNIGKFKDALSKAKDVMGKKVSKPDLSKLKERMPKYMQPLRRGGKARGPNRPRPTGPHMWVRGDKRKKYASGGAVMAGKKVGCQIK